MSFHLTVPGFVVFGIRIPYRYSTVLFLKNCSSDVFGLLWRGCCPFCLPCVSITLFLFILTLLLIHTCNAYLSYPCFCAHFREKITPCYFSAVFVSFLPCCPYDCMCLDWFFSTTLIPDECCTKTISNHLFFISFYSYMYFSLSFLHCFCNVSIA